MIGARKIIFSQNKLLISLCGFLNEEKTNGHAGDQLNKDLNVLFIHNPKVAGNSLIKILLGEKDSLKTSHKTPTFLVTKKTWEKSTSVVAIRHPLDRLISSYHYHTKASYQGVFLQKFPKLHEFSFEEYFWKMSHMPYVIMPQWYYTKHMLSDKPVDYLLRFEQLNQDSTRMFNELGLTNFSLPHLNASKREPQDYFRSPSFKEKVSKYYRRDFETFGYEPDFNKY